MTGRPLGSRYSLDREIGRGAMGSVWSGHRNDDGRQVAVKLLRSEYAEDTEIVHRFIQERSFLTRVVHANIVRVHDLVVEGSTLGIVMEYVADGDLRELLDARGTLPPAEAAWFGRQIALGLAAIHDGGVVHRDVKPGNVLIDRQDDGSIVPKVSDFGVARVTQALQSTATTAMLGTPLYMAPEIIEEEPPTPAADIYALGVMLYEMVAGVTPFAGPGGAYGVLRRHSENLPGRPEGFPDQLWTAVEIMVAKEATGRPSATEVAEELGHIAEELAPLPALGKLDAPPPGGPAPARRLPEDEAWTVDLHHRSPSSGSSPGSLSAGSGAGGSSSPAGSGAGGGSSPARTDATLRADPERLAGPAPDPTRKWQSAPPPTGPSYRGPAGMQPLATPFGGPGAPGRSSAGSPGSGVGGGPSGGPDGGYGGGGPGGGYAAGSGSDRPRRRWTFGRVAALVGGAAVALLGVFILIGVLQGSPQMPDLRGMRIPGAQEELGDQVEIATNEVLSDGEPVGTIVGQSPAPEEDRGREVTVDVAVASTITYLGDLDRAGTSSMTSDAIVLDEVSYPYGLHTGSWSSDGEHAWLLDGHYTIFRATIGRLPAEDLEPEEEAAHQVRRVRVQVYGDGALLQSGEVTLTQTLAVDLDVTGVQTLEIRYTSLDGGTAHLAVGDGRVIADPADIPADDDA